MDIALWNSYVLAPPYGSVECPTCHGGRTTERSFRVWAEGGKVSGKCFRASCGFFTSIGAGGVRAAVPPPALMPYRGERYPLTEEDKSYFLARYGVPAREVYDSGTGWYLFDVKDAEGARTGVLKRRPDPIAPLYTGDYGDAPKSILYRETTDAPLAFHLHTVCGRRRYSAPIVAVEDVISSMKLRYMGIDSVALLGVGLSDDKVAALQRVTENLIIALDADATGQAFALARKYGPAFDRCRVMLLNKDIKDDSHNDFLAQYLRLEPSHVPCALP